jgi:hypothetical protein
VSFHKQDFKDRFHTMGDPAEAAFQQVYEDTNMVRTGLDRPPIAMWMLPPVIRNIPDFLLSNGFVECMGVGRDQTLKLKVEKFESMRTWNELFGVRLFLWDSHHERWSIWPVDELEEIVADAPLDKFENDGNVYYKITLDTFDEDRWSDPF